MDSEEIKAVLREYGLRATGPRLAVVACLLTQARPLTYSEMVELIGQEALDPATIYRNLVKLTEIGLAKVVSHAEGMAHYELQLGKTHHNHAHFVCTDCGTVACLPETVAPKFKVEGKWADAVQEAAIQFEGTCPECRPG